MVVLREQVDHGGVEGREGVGWEGREDVVEEGEGLRERDAAAEREEAAEELEREVRRGRGREEARESCGEGGDGLEGQGGGERVRRVGAAVVEDCRVERVQELGFRGSQGRRGIGGRWRRRGERRICGWLGGGR
jgi:hypothetical protein